MATTTTPDVKPKTAPITLTPNAVAKVKEIHGWAGGCSSRWQAGLGCHT